MRRPRLAAAGLVLGLFAAACGDDEEPVATEDTAAATASTGATVPAAGGSTAEGPGDGLLSFTAPTVDGDEVDAAALAAGRDAVVWFWSPWCGSCNAEADGVGRVAADLGDDVAFFGIAGGAAQDEYEEFLAEHDLSAFPQLVDETGEVWLRFGADTIRSSFFFLDDTGETSVTGYGEIDEDELRERVEALLAS